MRAAIEVFHTFLRLGLTSFGGPVAHLAYFREAFVSRRQWLSDEHYTSIVAIAQLLPGPASSQVGMALGHLRAGWPGLIAAWIGFTLPSAVLMVLFAVSYAALVESLGGGWLVGMKAAVVGIVLHALVGMARSILNSALAAALAIGTALVTLVENGPLSQLLLIAASAAIAAFVQRRYAATSTRAAAASTGEAAQVRGATSPRIGVPASTLVVLLAFAALLVLLPLAAASSGSRLVALADGLYRSGALVFGGGHVVLPLLQTEIVDTGLVDQQSFIAGYAAAQAVPGPLFSFSAYVGAMADVNMNRYIVAAIAVTALFLPSLLLMGAVAPISRDIAANPRLRPWIAGASASVVGLLAAALWDPIALQGIRGPATFALAAATYVALRYSPTPPWLIVLGAAVLGHFAFAG